MQEPVVTSKFRQWADRAVVATVTGTFLIDLEGRPHPHFELPTVPAFLSAQPVLSTNTATWANKAW
jgi:hypothetical protein